MNVHSVIYVKIYKTGMMIENHSYLKDSIGSSRAALRAG